MTTITIKYCSGDWRDILLNADWRDMLLKKLDKIIDECSRPGINVEVCIKFD